MNIPNLNTNLTQNTLDNAKNHLKQQELNAKVKSAYSDNDKEKLKEVCDDFESIMLNMVFKEMRSTVPKSNLLGEAPGKEIFEAMYDEKLMEKAAKRGGIGLSKILYNQMSKNIDKLYKPE